MGRTLSVSLGVLAAMNAASHEGADARLGWRRVFSVADDRQATSTDWATFRSRCGGAASRRNETMAAADFAELVKDRVADWNGTVYRVGSHNGAPEVLVKMEPTDAFFHDLVLRAPSSLEGAVLGLSVGDSIRFEAVGIAHGGAYGYPTFEVTHLSRLVEDATEAEAASDGDAPEGGSWQQFRSACGQRARKANAFRAGASYRELFRGREVTWSGRVWVAHDGEGEHVGTARIKVKMSPADAWLYDIVVRAPASAVRLAAGGEAAAPRVLTKDYVTFTGTFAEHAGALDGASDVFVDASSVLVLPHTEAGPGHDEL